MLFLFECIAIGLSLATSNLFYLFNFTYIGGFIALGLALYTNQYRYARLVVQLGVGLYMLVYLGLLCNENMQIEGFWYYLFLGVFEAATIHYAVAKIFGPLLFGRGWCGYACWTAMILDLLPYKLPEGPRKRFGFIRYVVFTGSLVFVGALFVLAVPNLERVMFWSFLIGNAIYYVVGIALAYLCKDNRAFCKYICPSGTLGAGIPLLAMNESLRDAAGALFLWKLGILLVLLLLCLMVYRPFCKYICPLGAVYSLFNPVAVYRYQVDEEHCTKCGKCQRVCKMDIKVWEQPNHRECIRCGDCIKNCPEHAIMRVGKTSGKKTNSADSSASSDTP